MPAGLLYCETCGVRQTKQLEGTDFATFLAKGRVRFACEQCQQPTWWKLQLPPRGEPSRPPDQTARRILVIDDDPDTRRLVQQFLQANQYIVTPADSADTAFQLLQDEDFDIIVSDIRMPDFDGKNLFRFLAVYLPHYTNKIVFLTGDQSENTLQFLRESGCPSAFKPFDMEQLLALVRQAA